MAKSGKKASSGNKSAPAPKPSEHAAIEAEQMLASAEPGEASAEMASHEEPESEAFQVTQEAAILQKLSAVSIS